MKAEILAKLKKIPLFEEIKGNDKYMQELQGVCKLRNFGKDDVIIQEGNIGSEMFIVFTGGVEIRKGTRAGDHYTVIRLSAAQNVFFGEMALIDDDKRSATVIAAEESTFLVIDKKDFGDLGNRYPQIGLPITQAIAKIISSRLRKTTEDMMTIFDALVYEIRG